MNICAKCVHLEIDIEFYSFLNFVINKKAYLPPCIFPDVAELVPGLTKKPPLPKKLDTFTNQKINVINSDESKDIEAIQDFLLLKKTLAKNNEIYVSPKRNTENGLISEDEERYKENSVQNVYENIYEIPTKQDEMSVENDVIFQNWVDDVVQKESETDKYLHQLKNDHGISNYNLTDNSKIVNSLSWADEEKLPNISDIDLDRFFKENSGDLHSSKNKNKSPKAVNPIKILSKTANKEFNNSKSKQKTTIKSKKVDYDFDESPCNKDVDTWMLDSGKHNSDSSRIKNNFLDLLQNLEEIESQTMAKVKSSLPQNDRAGKLSQSGSIDDIASLMEVLENENKKSRKCASHIKVIQEMDK